MTSPSPSPLSSPSISKWIINHDMFEPYTNEHLGDLQMNSDPFRNLHLLKQAMYAASIDVKEYQLRAAAPTSIP